MWDVRKAIESPVCQLKKRHWRKAELGWVNNIFPKENVSEWNRGPRVCRSVVLTLKFKIQDKCEFLGLPSRHFPTRS